MITTLLINNLAFSTIIGILPFERESEQSIEISVQLVYNYENGEFINYADVAEMIRIHIQEGKFFLIEEALESLLSKLHNKYNCIKYLEITLMKPDILAPTRVGIRVEKNF